MPRATPAGPISAAWRNIVGDDAISVDTVSGGSSVTAHTVTVSKTRPRDMEDGWGVWGAVSGLPMFNRDAGPFPGPPCSTETRGRSEERRVGKGGRTRGAR